MFGNHGLQSGTLAPQNDTGAAQPSFYADFLEAYGNTLITIDMPTADPNSQIGMVLYKAVDGTPTAVFMLQQGSDTYCQINNAPSDVTIVPNGAAQPFIENGMHPVDAIMAAINADPSVEVPYTEVNFNSPYSATMADIDSVDMFTRAQMGFGVQDNPGIVVVEVGGDRIEIDPTIEASGYTFKEEGDAENPVIAASLGDTDYTSITTVASGPYHTVMAQYTFPADLRETFAQCMADAQTMSIPTSSAPSLSGTQIDTMSVDHILGTQCIDPADFNMDGAQVLQIGGTTGLQAVFSQALYLPEEGANGIIISGDYLRIDLGENGLSFNEDGTFSVTAIGNTFHISQSIRNNNVENHEIASCAGDEAIIIDNGVITQHPTPQYQDTPVSVNPVYPTYTGTPHTPGITGVFCVVNCEGTPTVITPDTTPTPAPVFLAEAFVFGATGLAAFVVMKLRNYLSHPATPEI